MDYNSRGEIRLSNFEKKKKNFGIDFEKEKIYISSVNIISRRKEGCSLPRLGARLVEH